MRWPFGRFIITGESMSPHFKAGDHIFVWRWGRIREGDVIVLFKYGLMIMKRAIKKEGDRWFVRGDNFSESTDSNNFGLITEKEIFGKVITKY